MVKKDQYQQVLKNLKTPNIMGREKYYHAVVLVPFVWLEGQYHLLLEKRAKKIRQGGEVSFPGGGFEADKDADIFATARRETAEELGISQAQISTEEQFDSIINPLGSLIDVVIGRLDISDLRDLEINRSEVQHVFTIPLKWLQENPPQTYRLAVEIHSQQVDASGKEITLFPAQELNIPQRYHKSWSGSEHIVYAWQYRQETIWGVTAEIIYELLKLL
jgi:8-oxo-dGTP pyrophosphatase MutT (NUDIX family)